MEASIFKDLVKKYFDSISGQITKKVNDKEEENPVIWKRYLKPLFTTDLKYSSLSSNNSIVAADVVELDTPLSLKSRGSISSADGEIPKLGAKYALKESQLQTLQILESRGGQTKQLISNLFKDLGNGVKGVYERLDHMFLQALSTGSILVDKDTNIGKGIRVKFINDKNQFGVTTTWDKATATPVDDIENITNEARNEGVILKYVMMDKATFNQLKSNDQIRKAFAGIQRVTEAHVFRLKKEDVEAYILEEFGLTIIIHDKVIQMEINGAKKPVTPWKKGSVTFTSTLDLGTLTYGELTEARRKVSGVEYSTVDGFILSSKYSKNDPLQEFTSVQALALPVLNETQNIFIMDTTEAIEVDAAEVEGDATITIWGSSLTKATVISEFNNLEGVSNTTSTVSDAKLIERISQLSDADVATLKAALGL